MTWLSSTWADATAIKALNRTFSTELEVEFHKMTYQKSSHFGYDSGLSFLDFRVLLIFESWLIGSDVPLSEQELLLKQKRRFPYRAG